MICVLLISYLLVFERIEADEHDHIYKDGEEVVIWMNTVGPYHNRQEMYSYYSLPFCRGPKQSINHYHETMGEALLGIQLEFSGLDVHFKTDVPMTSYCTKELSEVDYQALNYAVQNQYWYQMYIDDLPIWTTVGHLDKDGSTYIWTHKNITLKYNGFHVIEASLTAGHKQALKPQSKISFTYQITWEKTDVSFANRFKKYLDSNFFEHRIHWFSIFNSFMMVLFLVGLVSMILLRTLRKDYSRYSKEDDMDELEGDLGDEYGWKQVHGDVFRSPAHPALFSSLVGSGAQLALVTGALLALAALAKLYTERGTILSTAIFLYAVSAPLNGFVGGALFSRLGGRRWIRQMLLGTCLVPGVAAAVGLLINCIAVYYQATRAVPFLIMLAIVSIGLFVVLPLNLIGCVMGRNMSGQPNHPCRVNAVPRPIPEKKWFMEPAVIVLLGGVLPFGSIFIEMYFVFTSFWAYKIYFVFGFALLVLSILFIVTSCVTTVCTYFLLNSEDYRWQWTSFLVGSSTALYVYFYSIFYFFFKTKMFGLFQTAFYFGYMALFSFGLALICGTVGYLGASSFVRKIYSAVKID